METLFSWLDQTINKNPVAALTVLVAIFIFLFGYLLVRLQEQIRSLGDYVDDRESALNQKYRSLCASISTLTDLYQNLNGRIEDPDFKGNLAIAKDLVAIVNGFLETNSRNRLDLSTRFESHREVLQELVATCSRLDTRINVQQMAVQSHIEDSNTHFCRLDNGLQSLEESLGNRLDEVESALETVEDTLKYGTASDTDAVKDELLDRLEAKQAIRCDHCVVTLDGQFLGEATVMISQPRGRGLAEPTRLEITTQRIDANVSALKAETSQLAPEVQTTKWVPQVGDWVKIKKPESWMYTAWMQDMDKYDGEVVQVTEIEGTAIIHDDWAFCFEWLEPAEVKEIATAISNTGEFSQSGKPLNSDKIPEGYRKLGDSIAEPRRLGDLRWSVAQKRYVEITFEEIGYANRDNWAACRIISGEVTPEVTPEVTGEAKPEWMPAVGERVRFKGQPAARPDWIVNHLSDYSYVLLKRSTDGVPSGGYVSQLEPAPKPEQETEAPKPRFSRGELVRIVCPKGLLPGETYKDPISKLSFWAEIYEAYLGKEGQIVGPSSSSINGLWDLGVFVHRNYHKTIRLPEAMLEKVLS